MLQWQLIPWLLLAVLFTSQFFPIGFETHLFFKPPAAKNISRVEIPPSSGLSDAPNEIGRIAADCLHGAKARDDHEHRQRICVDVVSDEQARDVLDARWSQVSMQVFQRRYGKRLPSKRTFGFRTRKTGEINQTSGSWTISSNSRYFLDEGFALAVATVTGNSSVTNLGAGRGHYENFQNWLNLNGPIAAYDGGEGVEESTCGLVRQADLTQVLDIVKSDWVTSFEVAEHIPSKFENIMLTNFQRHSFYGLIVSWGQVGQHGEGHVNGKLKRDAVELIESAGFDFLPRVSDFCQRHGILPQFQQNVMVFCKRRV